MCDNIFSSAVGLFLPYLSRQRYSSKYPESISATFFLCHARVTFRPNWWCRMKNLSFSEELNAWNDVKNNFHNFLGKHCSEIFTLNKKFKKNNIQHTISFFPTWTTPTNFGVHFNTQDHIAEKSLSTWSIFSTKCWSAARISTTE